MSADCYHVYVGNASSSTTPYFYRISIANHEVTYKALPKRVFNSVVVGDYIWATGGLPSPTYTLIQQIDKKTLEVVWSDETTVIDGRAIAYDGKYVWLADRSTSGKLHRINPATRKIVSYPGIVLEGARHFAFDGTYLWLSCNIANAVLRINPDDPDAAVTVSSINDAWGICFDGENIIVAGISGNIFKINPETATIIHSVTLADCSFLCHCSFDGTNVWIADNMENDIKIIDHETLDLIDTKQTLTKPLGTLYDGKYHWIPVEQNIKIEKMTL